MAKIVLLVPTARAAVETRVLAERPKQVSRIGFLHNGQPIFDGLALLLTAALLARSGLTVVQDRKSRYSSPAPEELLAKFASGTQAAIVGLAC